MRYKIGDRFYFGTTEEVYELYGINKIRDTNHQQVLQYHLRTVPSVSGLKKQRFLRYALTSRSLERFFILIPDDPVAVDDLFIPDSP